MEYRILGPLAVLRDGQPLALGGLRQRAVLAVLLLAGEHAVGAEQLVDRVWEGGAPPKPLASLRAYVTNLRRILGDQVISREGSGYLLRLDDVMVDARHFAVLMNHGRKMADGGDPTAALSALDAALALWRGDPLTEFRELSFVQPEVHRLEAMRVDAVESRYDAALRLGLHTESIAGLEAEVARTPLREKLWWQLMLALQRAGRRNDALRAYARVRDLLDAELGVPPGAELERLATDVRNESAALSWQPTVDAVASLRAPRPHGLFGRTTELARLSRSLGAACARQGGVVVVGGESGIGKTALAQRVAVLADELGMATTWAGHAADVRRPPSWAWAHAVRSLAGQLPRGSESQPSALLPQWWRVATERANAGDAAPAGEFGALEATTAALAELAARRPALIVLDDLQRADRFTVDVLEHLASAGRRIPLLIVATWQEGATDVAAGVRDLERLRSRTDVEYIGLRPLTVEASTALIADVSGTEPSSEIAERVHRRTGGNPFFMRELVTLLSDGGRLREPATTGEDVPEAVSGVIRRRMSQFPGATRDLLRAAAVLGAEFRLARLGLTVGVPPAQVVSSLTPALAAGLLIAAPNEPAVLRFGHGLVRDAIANELTPHERVGLHAAIARAFAVAPDGVTSQDAIDGAEHAWRAGDAVEPEVALRLLERARTDAWSRSAYRDLAELDRRALRLCARLPEGQARVEREVDLQLQLASVEAVVSGQSSAEVLADLRKSTGGEHDALQSTTAVAMGCLEACGTGRYYDAAVLSDGLIEYFAATRDPISGAAGYYIRALTDFMRGNLHAALGSVRTLQSDVPAIDPAYGALASFEVLAHGVAGHAHGLRGDVGAAKSVLAAGASEAAKRGDAFGAAVLRVADLQLCAMLGVTDDVAARADDVLRELTMLGVDQFIGGARVIQAWACALGPGSVDTVDAMRAAIELHGKGGRRIFSPLYLGLLSDAVARHRDDGAALKILANADALAAATGERVWDAQLSARRLRLAARMRTT